MAQAGHELPYYPSFYPSEVRLEAVGSASPARDSVVHALGGSSGTRSIKASRHVESLRSLIIVTLKGRDRDRPRLERCALIDRAGAQAAASKKAIFYPYPVTPYHHDYLFHFDRIQSAMQQSARPDPTGAAVETTTGAWNDESVAVKEVLTEDLIAATPPFTGWPRSPWAREGWFQAHRLLSPLLQDPDLHRQRAVLYERITRGDYRDSAERTDLQRRLVILLLHECQAAVAGYTLRHEVLNDDYASGIENVAHDAQAGLNSAIFLRTVKLKDFPWNGRLNLTVSSSSDAAWNPIAGFGDPFGRLLWAAIADPVLLPHPYDGTWLPNRIEWSVPDSPWTERAARLLRGWLGRGTDINVPPDAMLPNERGTAFQPVGPGQQAALRIRYRVLTSAFHDGTAMQLADALYPYMLLYRLGQSDGADAPDRQGDAGVESQARMLKAMLAGIKVVAIEEKVKDIGDRRLVWHIPVIDIYVRGITDAKQAAVVAPPWSTVPWHVLVLMEEAVRRGLGSFSQLDLVRGEEKNEMAALVNRLGTEAFVPAGLKEFVPKGLREYVPAGLRAHVTVTEARFRWFALRRFYLRRGHFLVTNGPYQLERWTRTSATLRAFRDMSYPLVIGSFDRFAVPRHGYVVGTARHGDIIEITADVEKMMKFGRTYKILREPLRKEILTGLEPVRPACRYVVLDEKGSVLGAGDAAYDGDRLFKIRLPAAMGSRLLVAVYVDDNYINPPVSILEVGNGR